VITKSKLTHKETLPGGGRVEIYELAPYSIKLSIQPSSIEGRGVFAVEEIIGGMPLGVYEGRVGLGTYSKFTVECYEDETPAYTIEGTGPLRYLNHSDDPNCEMSGVWVYSKHTVPPGTELTLDYGSGWYISHEMKEDSA